MMSWYNEPVEELTQGLPEPETAHASGTPAQRSLEKERCLGHGPLGEAWSAIRPDTGQKFVIKYLRAWNDHTELQQRLTEIVTLPAHPHIATITDVELSHSPPYLTMPLYEGSLGALARQEKHNKLDNLVLGCLLEAAAALQFLHQRGIVHANLKPENILLDREGSVRLTDVGLSLAKGGSFDFGGYYFMPPEQVAGTGFSSGWDIYSLGATFYYILTGIFPRGSVAGLAQLQAESDLKRRGELYCYQLRVVPLQPLRQLNPALNSQVAAVIERCLHLDPRQRYSSAEEVIRLLQIAEKKLASRALVVRWSAQKLRNSSSRWVIWTALGLEFWCIFMMLLAVFTGVPQVRFWGGMSLLGALVLLAPARWKSPGASL